MTIIDAPHPTSTARPTSSPATSPATSLAVKRTARTRDYSMCAPTHFTVEYAINPWMDPSRRVDTDRAVRQWERLVQTYRDLGHRVQTVDPMPSQPDMVFAANGALCVADRAYGASFRHVERQPEAAAWARHLRARGFDVVRPHHINEGEGDFLVLGHVILAGTGFRTEIAAHVEAAEVLDRPVVSLELVNPRYYHLDVALAVLDDGRGDAPADIAYVPSAFSAHSRRTLRDLFPHALQVSEADAAAFGLNCVSDGAHVVIAEQARGLIAALEARGYTPVPVNVDELLKSGGSVKCCTMEHHR